MQAPAEEAVTVAEQEEEGSAPASSRFDYDSIVAPGATTADAASAPKRGKDGHLTLDIDGLLLLLACFVDSMLMLLHPEAGGAVCVSMELGSSCEFDQGLEQTTSLGMLLVSTSSLCNCSKVCHVSPSIGTASGDFFAGAQSGGKAAPTLAQPASAVPVVDYTKYNNSKSISSDTFFGGDPKPSDTVRPVLVLCS